MIHEIFPHRFNNQFIITDNIAEDDYILHYNEHSVLLKTTGDGFEIPRKKDVSAIFNSIEGTFLFTLNDVRCFLIREEPKCQNDGFSYKEISFFRFFQPQEQPGLALSAFS